LLYEYEVKARRDEIAKIDAARTEGLITVARNMLERNMTMTDIAEITGLSFDEIKKIAH
jgi:DNA-binding phage protein